MKFEPIYNEKARFRRLQQIKTVIADLKKFRNKRLRKKLFEQILNYLESHHDHTGGFETPFLETAEEVADFYAVGRRTIQRWKKKAHFPYNGEIFDCWAIDCWLIKHGKVTEDFRIIRSKKFS